MWIQVDTGGNLFLVVDESGVVGEFNTYEAAQQFIETGEDIEVESIPTPPSSPRRLSAK